MPNILVTGCAGFIGWNVSELLLAKGHTVVGADNFDPAYDVRLKEWRLERLKQRDGFAYHSLDVCDLKAVHHLFQQHSNGMPIEAVVHLAARAGVRQSIRDPWGYYETNVTGALNTLEAAVKIGVGKFVLASSSSLYGQNNPRPYAEGANTDRPISPYAASKKAAEVVAYTYHHLYGTDVTLLRYFTVYGPAGRPDMSIFRFVHWITEGQSLVVYGDGRQERDFTYVDDIAEGTVAALELSGFEIINLGGGNAVPLLEVIHHIQSLVGNDAKLKYLPSQPTDVSATLADISKAERLLSWKPKTSIKAGLKNVVDWYMENRSWAKHIELGEY